MAQLVSSLLQPLLGIPCWHVQWERHTNLSMQFGVPSLAIREPQDTTATSPRVRDLARYRHVALRGAWMLWIQHAYWQVRLRDGQVITQGSSQRQRHSGLSRLDGQYLCAITIAPTTARTIFQFDLGTELTVRRWGNSKEATWMMYTPEKYVLTIRNDGRWQSISETPSPDSVDAWLQLEGMTIVSESAGVRLPPNRAFHTDLRESGRD